MEKTHFIYSIDDFEDRIIKNKYSKVLLLTDQGALKNCWQMFSTKFQESVKVLVLDPLTEQEKSIETCEKVWSFMLSNGFDRYAHLINLGGGILSDLGGFCAATFKRGISYSNIPTTLVGMIDAAIGGKTAVNFSYFKNQIGVFAEPENLLIDPVFLKTLSAREINSGKGEVIKYGLIRNKSIWKDLLASDQLDRIPASVIKPCIEIKKDIVERDRLERNERKLLNFGHTVGHAFEALCNEKGFDFTHGECIAWGIVVECELSKNLLGFKDLEIIKEYVERHFRSIPFSQLNPMQLIEYMKADKKNKAGQINFTLLRNIGEGIIDCYADVDQIAQSLKFIGCC